jgi:DNA-binding NarL/FixJ family response regulator
MKPKVLLAEDHPAMRMKIAGILERDFEVVANVGNGLAAVEAANKLLPDVLILDVSMPLLDGADAARFLKTQGCQAKIVFLSVSRDPNQVATCFAAGGDAYVSKIRMVSDLIHAITEVLAGKRFVSADVSFYISD